jgi:transcriptional regulator with XRE-family HTH domain
MIGTVIRQRRAAMGMSLRELSRVLGCNASTVCRWERDTHPPSVYWLRRLETALGYRLGGLLRQM